MAPPLLKEPLEKTYAYRESHSGHCMSVDQTWLFRRKSAEKQLGVALKVRESLIASIAAGDV